MEQILKAAEQVKSAVEELVSAVAAASGPPDPEKMTEDQRKRWGDFLNIISVMDFDKKLDAIDDKFGDIEKKIEDMVESAVDRAKSDMGMWDELDPSDVEEAVDAVDRMPSPQALEEAVEKVEELDRKFDGLTPTDEIEGMIDELREELKPVLDMLAALREQKRLKNVS